jgi:hypothetical protein
MRSDSANHVPQHKKSWRISRGRVAKHARSQSTRWHLITTIGCYCVAGSVLSALLVGLEGQHGGKSPLKPSLSSSSRFGYVPMPAAPGAVTPTSNVANYPAPSTRAWPTTKETVTRMAAHPIDATTVTTIVSHPTESTTVTTVTTVIDHPTTTPATISTSPTSPTNPVTVAVSPGRPTGTGTGTVTVAVAPGHPTGTVIVAGSPSPPTVTPTTTTTSTTTTTKTHPTGTTKPTTSTTTTTTTVTVKPNPSNPTTATTSTTTTTTTTTVPTKPIVAAPISPGSTLQGVYAGPANPAGVTQFDQETGTHAVIASEYLPQASGWDGMDGSGGSLAWMTDAWQKTGYILSLGVPMLPKTPAGDIIGSLATGATGAYNTYFVTLAQTLVSAGEGNAILRLGWEFDGGWYAWSATTPSEEASFATYFQQIVTAMRSVPGEAFRFEWNPDATAFSDLPWYNVTLAYPGNAYVDYIGLDAYDQTWATPQTPATAWNVTLLPALTAARNFAAAQGKPVAIPEWGVAIRQDGHGLGDDPNYIDNMAGWMQANGVAYESYFNYNGGETNSTITSGLFPNSLAAFQADFG